jgi:hypothetical protein
MRHGILLDMLPSGARLNGVTKRAVNYARCARIVAADSKTERAD